MVVVSMHLVGNYAGLLLDLLLGCDRAARVHNHIVTVSIGVWAQSAISLTNRFEICTEGLRLLLQ